MGRAWGFPRRLPAEKPVPSHRWSRPFSINRHLVILPRKDQALFPLGRSLAFRDKHLLGLENGYDQDIVLAVGEKASGVKRETGNVRAALGDRNGREGSTSDE
jgi:hypothetical protein